MNKKYKRILVKIRVLLLTGILSGTTLFCQVALAEEETEGFATAENVLEVDSEPVGESITVDAEPVEEFQGTVIEGESVINGNQSTCEFTYTAPRDGLYYFSLVDASPNIDVFCDVYDPLGNKICGFYNDDRFNAEITELEESKTYTIRVFTYGASANFTVLVYIPEASRDIPETAEVIDQLSFPKQENVYYYTALADGKYSFFLSDTTPNITFTIKIEDQYGMEIVQKSDNMPSVSIDLEENEIYEILVTTKSNKEFGKYTLNTMMPKPTMDVTGYTNIHDSLEFEEQINIYSFEAPVDGLYMMTLTDAKGISKFKYSIYDSYGEVLDSSNKADPNEEVSVTMYDGDQYFIEIQQYDLDGGTGSYTLNIDYPASAQQYLDNFSNGGVNEDSDDKKEENSVESAEDNSSEDLILQQLEELQSEMNELENENEVLKNILEENEIEFD